MSDDGPLGGMFQPAAPDPRDPARVAAEHQAAAEAAQRDPTQRDHAQRDMAQRDHAQRDMAQTQAGFAPGGAADAGPSRHPAGAHRASHQPSRLLLPALIAVLGVGALAVGLIGWFHTDDPDPSGLVNKPSISSSVSAGSPSPSPSPSSTASEDTSESPSPSPSTTPSTTPTPSTSATAPAVIVRAPTVVLNETKIVGLAAKVAARLRSEGWTVTGTANWRGSVASTTVYYPVGMQAAATSLAKVLGVDRIRPRVAGMLTNRLTVVLTSNPFG